MGAEEQDQFIVPPPGMVPTKDSPQRSEAVAQEPAESIELPPGIVDSATYRVAAAQAPRPSRADNAPAFFPTGVQAVSDVAAAGAGVEPAVNVVEDAPGSFDAIDGATTVAMRTPTPPRWSLSLPHGESIVLERAIVIGRDPAPHARWPDATLMAVADPGKSVSKTHAVLQLAADGQLFVHDLHSTNGVFVRHAQADEVVVEPGNEAVITAPSELRLGQFVITVERS